MVETVDSARARMLGAVQALGGEPVALPESAARTLVETLFAARDQPPFRSSAMDGYALRLGLDPSGPFSVVGESAAGSAYQESMQPGEAIRIFTGAPVPIGAGTVIPQERVRREGDSVFISEPALPGRNIRESAIDFAAGSALIGAGTRLHARHIALMAAAGIASVSVRRVPRVALMATGSEIAVPGTAAGPYQIYDSVTFGLGAMIERWGGCPVRLAATGDDEAAVAAAIGDAIGSADLTVIVGGASVGDYDIVKHALGKRGLKISVPRVAVRPGKPTWFGRIDAKPILGLPGNPAAAFVCATLFLRPLLHAFLARDTAANFVPAVLDGQIARNGDLEAYLRADARVGDDARLAARPFDNQDTSLVSIFAAANALIRRLPGSGSAAGGALVEVLLLDCD